MPRTNTVEQARRLYRDGQVDEARAALLAAGYGPEPDDRARSEFGQLFPAEGVLREKLAGVVADLGSATTAVRQRASDKIATDARKATTAAGRVWLGDPRTTGPLVAALGDENPAVAENAAIALAEITRRYFADHRAYPAAVRLLASKRWLTRSWTVQLVLQLGGAGAATAVLPALSDKSAKVRAAVVLGLGQLAAAGQLPGPMIDRITDPVVGLVGDEDTDVRMGAVNLLRDIGTAPLVPHLVAASGRESNRHVRDALTVATNAIQMRAAVTAVRKTV